MSVAKVNLHPEARLEVREALDWYLERSVQAADGFLDQFDLGIQFIVQNPESWPEYEAGTRRCVLRKYPYSIVYREVGEFIEVVAVTHHKRRPRYWVGR